MRSIGHVSALGYVRCPLEQYLVIDTIDLPLSDQDSNNLKDADAILSSCVQPPIGHLLGQFDSRGAPVDPYRVSYSAPDLSPLVLADVPDPRAPFEECCFSRTLTVFRCMGSKKPQTAWFDQFETVSSSSLPLLMPSPLSLCLCSCSR